MGSAGAHEYEITFVIPHRGRHALLMETIKSIQQLDEIDNAVVVIVTQSEDLTAGIIPSPTCNVDVLILHRPQTDTIAALRNVGARHTTSPLLAFLDADIALQRNWLTTLRADLQSGRGCLLSSTQVAATAAPPVERVRAGLSQLTADREVASLPGCNLFLRREVFDKVGGFPDHLLTCEDYYFSDQARRFGRLYCTSATSFVHLGEDKSLSQLFKKEVWRSQSNLQAMHGRRVPLSEWPSIVIPVFLTLAFLGAAVALVMMAWIPALFLLIAAMAPAVAYSLRLWLRLRGRLPIHIIFPFYTVYFFARATGLSMGICKSVRQRFLR